MESLKKSYPTFEKLLPLAVALEHPCPLRIRQVMQNCRVDFDRKSDELSMTDQEFEEGSWRFLALDILQILEIRKEKMKVAKLIATFDERPKNWAFVTIGFNDSIVVDENETLVFNSTVAKILETPGFDVVKFSCEKFRVDGIHRHIHFLMNTTMRKSKIIQYAHSKSKKWTYGEQCVDVKTYKNGSYEVYLKYVQGDKAEEKLECVQKDREWRRLKNIREE